MKVLVFLSTFLILFLLCDSKPKKKNYYEELDVDEKATLKEIKKAYFSLAKIYHPDKNENYDKKKTQKEKFERISYAYEILSDQEKRDKYDRLLSFGEVEYKETPKENSEEKKDTKKYSFKDPMKAYQDELKKAEDEAFRDTMYTVILGTFLSIMVIILVWIGFKMMKKTKYYKAKEQQKQESVQKDKMKEKLSKKVEVANQKQLKKEQDKKKHIAHIQRIKAEREEALRLAAQEPDDEDDYDEVDEDVVDDGSFEDEEEEEEEESEEEEDEELKNTLFCTACKKPFKSVNQWDHHENSAKHKKRVKTLKGESLHKYEQQVEKINNFINQEISRLEKNRLEREAQGEIKDENNQNEEKEVEKTNQDEK